MTAPTGPDDNFHVNQEISSSEHEGFIYDSPEVQGPEEPEYEANYEPEREFVLMPLFRRIGELLGIGRKSESDQIYGSNRVAPDRPAEVEIEPEPIPSVQAAVTELHAPQESIQEHDSIHEAVAPVAREDIAVKDDDVLGIEPPVVAEPLIVQAQQQFEPESESPIAFEPAEPKRISISEPQPEPEVAVWTRSSDVIAGQSEAAPPQVQASQPEPAPPVIAKPEASHPQPPVRLLTQDDIKELVAPIREAVASISLAISQAAEWLRNKEEEILRRAETPVAQPSEAGKRGPQLVSKPARVPFWKRIDWEKEFTPGRAAILGALAMAVLMVLGISLARRPASSVLPQQSHAIEPGGVTLSTHPATTATPSSHAQRRTTVPAHSAAPGQRSAHRSANEGDGPDVVTHYYGNKSKPSPAHQSTIAGVRHYSDM